MTTALVAQRRSSPPRRANMAPGVCFNIHAFNADAPVTAPVNDDGEDDGEDEDEDKEKEEEEEEEEEEDPTPAITSSATNCSNSDRPFPVFPTCVIAGAVTAMA